MSQTKHYQILVSGTLINEEQLEDFLSEGWVLIQIVPSGNDFYFYFYRN